MGENQNENRKDRRRQTEPAAKANHADAETATENQQQDDESFSCNLTPNTSQQSIPMPRQKKENPDRKRRAEQHPEQSWTGIRRNERQIETGFGDRERRTYLFCRSQPKTLPPPPPLPLDSVQTKQQPAMFPPDAKQPNLRLMREEEDRNLRGKIGKS